MRHILGIWMLAAMLAACGGGGSSDDANPDPTPDPDPQPSRFSISGSLYPAGDAAIDGDTADPTVPRTSNDFVDTPQVLRNPVTLGGHASLSADELDIFRLELAAGQVINLFIAEDGEDNDLDLYLADTDGEILDFSLGRDKFETLTVPASGTYLIGVEAFVGASNYVLTVTQADATGSAARHALHSQAEFVPGQALVQFEAGGEGHARAKSHSASRLAAVPEGVELLDVSVHAKAATAKPRGGLQVSDPALAEKLQTLETIKALHREPGVAYAEPNLIRHATAVPNDEFFGQQWHYPLINLPQAWDITTGSPDVIVAVADTGVRLSHPDLQGQFDPRDPDGFDFISDARNSLDGNGIDGNADDPGDGGLAGNSSFHGTHVAGTIAAATNNRIGVAGVAWNARIMPLRVLGAGGSGSSFDIQNAVLYAAGLPNATGQLPPRRADILNLSLGADSGSQSEQRVYTQARAAGLIIIAAAGNSGDARLSFPASYDGVVSVAAVGRQKQRAPYSQFNAAVDVAAPGGDQSRGNTEGVLSTRASDSGGAIRDTVSFLQGTSMATPHMAGVVALMKAVHPGLTPAQLDTLLASGSITEDLGAAGRDNQFGHGLIDANLAVRQAIALANGATPADNPRLAATPAALHFGNGLTQIELALGNAGTGTLQVTGISDDAPWLTVSALATDGSTGLGRYTVRVDRSGLATGTHAATISVGSSVNVLQIPVLVTVGTTGGSVDAGKQYVLLIDAATSEVLDQDEMRITSGRYDYRFDDVPPGDYLIVSGTDSDDDGFICDDGESCGSFPELDLPTPLTISNADRNGIDFLVSFDLSTPTLSQTTPGNAPPKFHRLK